MTDKNEPVSGQLMDDERGPPDDFGPPGNDDGGPPLALSIRRNDAIAKGRETQVDAAAAAAAKELEVRYALARRFPRELDTVERRLLASCSRPAFAGRARYARPVGGRCQICDGKKTVNEKPCDACLGTGKGYAHGFSIRFAEEALAALGNLATSAEVIYQDHDRTRIRCVAVDLETNASWSVDADVPRTVERKKLKHGQVSLAVRQNSYGDTVYIVPAEPAEHEVLIAATASKKMRDLILRLLPADVKEACEAQVKATLNDEFRKQAAAAVKKLSDAFSKLRPPVSANELAAYLGHPLEAITLEEYEILRAVYGGVAEGFTTWATLLADKRGDVERGEGDKPLVDELKERLAKKVAAKQGAAPQPQPGDPTKGEPQTPKAG